MSLPVFPATIEVLLHNPRTDRPYTLVRADALEVTPARLTEMVAASNEPAVYEWLWRERLEGQPYSTGKAEEFFDWARAGWRDGTHFVFLILGPQGVLAGALDIKSADLGGDGGEGAEIGYLLRAAHSGAMTPAVLALQTLARKAGYRSLWARVRPGNERSRRVLERAGFREVGEMASEGQRCTRHELSLEPG